MAQMKVFVSHSHTNNAFCQELVTGLKAAGADVWYDNESMHAGQLGPVIERELRERTVFIVVLSPDALRSRWVEDETRWAYGQLRRDPSRIILPVLAEALPDENDIWLFLQDFKRVEASGLRPFSPAEAVARTLHALQLTLPGEAPQPTAPQPAESASDLVSRGKALQAQGKHAEALPLFQRATQLDPRSFDAWSNLGYTLYNVKRPAQEQLDAFECATTLDPNNAIAWHNKGGALDTLGRRDEALAAYDRALALDPNYVSAWYGKGVVLSALSRNAEALAACDQALALDPKHVNAWVTKGVVLKNLQRYDEALDACEQALALAPQTLLALANKGVVLWWLSRYPEALTACERALALDSSSATAWDGKSWALYSLNRFDEALLANDRALALDPAKQTAWSGRARVLRALGRVAEAEEAERRAKALGA